MAIMIRQVLRIGFVSSLLVWTGWGSGATPPVKCDRQTAGSFWPEAANRDPAARKQAERCGTLLYCARTTFGWKWQALTVSLQSMIARAAGVEAACAAGVAAPATKIESPQNPPQY